MSKFKIILFPMFRYYSPKLLETMFETQARQGWIPKVNLLSFFYIIFIKEKSEKCQYFIDFQYIYTSKYVKIYTEFDMKLVGKISNIVVWKCNEQSEKIKIYTLKESEKLLNKFLVFYWIIGIALATISIVLLITLIINFNFYSLAEVALNIFVELIIASLCFGFIRAICKTRNILKRGNIC